MKTEIVVKLCFGLLLAESYASKIYSDVWGEIPRVENFDVEPEEKNDNKIPRNKYVCNDTNKCIANYDFWDALARKKHQRKMFANKKLKKSQTIRLPTCSCGMEYDILELGMQYYPRYIPTVSCKMENCWMSAYKCRPRRYKVKVLKRKEAEDENSNSSLPEALKDEWVMETVTVTVACECSP